MKDKNSKFYRITAIFESIEIQERVFIRTLELLTVVMIRTIIESKNYQHVK
jgi:hypothetical protein